MIIVTTAQRAGGPQGRTTRRAAGKLRDRAPLRDRVPLPAKCRNGHQFTTRARVGSSIRCPECRAPTWVCKPPAKPPTRREIQQAQRQAEEQERQQTTEQAAAGRREMYRRAAERARQRAAQQTT